MTRVHLIRTPAEFSAVLAAAKLDDHASLCPTHWIAKDGLVSGCFGLNSIPFVETWFSTKRMKVRDTLQAIAIGEGILEAQGHTLMAVPCPEKSPLFPYMKRLGFHDTGPVHIFTKELKG